MKSWQRWSGWTGLTIADCWNVSVISRRWKQKKPTMLHTLAKIWQREQSSKTLQENRGGSQTMRKEINALAFAADWVLPGLSEGQLLTGEKTPEGIADFYLNQGVKAVIIKTGPDGAWFKTADGEQAQVAACKVENVVDTVGAGDGFAVGLVSALLEGLTLEQAVKRGNKIGSLAVQAVGDSEGLPTREQLDGA